MQPPKNDHFQQIYGGDQTAWYDLMVSREDVSGNLTRTLRELAADNLSHILDVGAGTGRVSRILLPEARQVVACDINLPMLHIAQPQAEAYPHWHLCAGDSQALPIRSGWASLALAGWALGHTIGWFPDTWRTLIDNALHEMARTLRSGGVQIIIETMGTGFAEPAPPHEGLAAYYAHMEQNHGFTRHVIRTDYRFASVEEAVRLVGFFFGEELAQRLHAENSPDLIEWTGIWARRVG